MEFQRCKQFSSGQKIISLPKRCDLEDGDWVKIIKISKEELKEDIS